MFKGNQNKKEIEQQLPSSRPYLPTREPDNFDVVLDEEQGYYLMGRESDESQTFVLSVSISGIKDLISVSVFCSCKMLKIFDKTNFLAIFSN